MTQRPSREHGPPREMHEGPGEADCLAACPRSQRNTTEDLRLQRTAERLHRLGDRVLYEFCREIAERVGAFELLTEADVIALAERYAALPADLIQALGGDRLQPPPLLLVPAEFSTESEAA